MTNMPSRSRGFTLLELMITIVVAAILVAIALPGFRDLIHRNQVSSASNALLASLSYARTEAITRGQIVSMCPGSKASGCASGGTVYDTGWIVYTYPAGAASTNKAYVAGTSTLLRATGQQSGVSILSLGSTVISFGLQGQLKPSAPTLSFDTCYRSGSTGAGESTSKAPGVQLNVNGSGNITTAKLGSGASCTPS